MAQQNDTSIARVSQIHTLTAEFLKKRLAQQGFDDFASSHGYILYQLSVNPKITMKDLAAKINRDKSTTTVLVRKLEAAGLIKITVDQNDKRNKILSLTAKGSEYNQMTSSISQELLSTFYKGFSNEEKLVFSEFLDRIKGNFEPTI